MQTQGSFDTLDPMWSRSAARSAPRARTRPRAAPRLALLLAALEAGACRSEPDRTEASPAPNPAANPAASPAADPSGPRPVRIAMSAAFVSEAGIPVYDDITRFLSLRLGDEVEFVTGLGYSTINGMLESGVVDVGFVCGLPYVMLHDRDAPPVHLLAAPVMKAARYQGEPKYYSDLIVKRDSPIQSIHELRGRTYVFNEEISNSGYNMPRWRLLQLGLRDGFFGQVVRSGSHEESIRMVATGRADASFVDSLVLEYDQTHGLGVADQVRVIESIGPAGIPPVVVSDKVAPDLRDRLQGALLRMHEDPQGREILDRALVDRFVEVDDDDYDDIREMIRAAQDADFLTIR